MKRFNLLQNVIPKHLLNIILRSSVYLNYIQYISVYLNSVYLNAKKIPCFEKLNQTLVCCWWDYKMVQPLWKTDQWFIKKVNTELSQNPANLVLVYNQSKKNRKKEIKQIICTLMLIAALLFTIAKRWKQLKCLSTNEHIKKMCCVQMEYYSALYRKKILTHYNIDET